MRELWLRNWETILSSTVVVAIIGGLFMVIGKWIDKRGTESKSKHIYRQARHTFRQAEAYEEHKDYPKALEYYLKAAGEYANDTLEQAWAFFNAGFICLELKLYEEAIECTLKAKAIYINNPIMNRHDLTLANANIACAYGGQEKYNEALELHLKAYRCLAKYGKNRLDTVQYRKDMRIDYEAAQSKHPDQYPEPFSSWLSSQLSN